MSKQEKYRPLTHRAVLIGGPSSGTGLDVEYPVKEITLPTITSKGATTETYDLIGLSPKGRYIYEHRGAVT